MIATLRERARQWWLTRDLLLVNFGSGPGRVPLVILSRRQIANVIRVGSQISFGTRVTGQAGWKFIIHTDSPASAETIARALEHRRRHVLEPLEAVLCIIHYRSEDRIPDALPRCIGGNIALAMVPESEYWRNGNGAWINKHFQSE